MVSGILFMCLKYHHFWCQVGCLLNPMAFHSQDNIFTLVCLCFHINIRGRRFKVKRSYPSVRGYSLFGNVGMLVELIPAVSVRL